MNVDQYFCECKDPVVTDEWECAFCGKFARDVDNDVEEEPAPFVPSQILGRKTNMYCKCHNSEKTKNGKCHNCGKWSRPYAALDDYRGAVVKELAEDTDRLMLGDIDQVRASAFTDMVIRDQAAAIGEIVLNAPPHNLPFSIGGHVLDVDKVEALKRVIHEAPETKPLILTRDELLKSRTEEELATLPGLSEKTIKAAIAKGQEDREAATPYLTAGPKRTKR